jgi:hypothetical protein
MRKSGWAVAVAAWARLLRCTECAERDADFVVSGTRKVSPISLS